jgi:nucleotide-binding universal stress UspA family protein
MNFKDLLVHVDSTSLAERRLDLALALAARRGARLTGLFAESGSLGQSIVGRRGVDQLATARAEARALFEAKVAAAGIASRWWQVESGDYGDLTGWTVQCCRYVDLAIFGQPPENEGRVPGDLVQQVVFQGGRPVLAVPRFGALAEPGKRVLIAWTGSRAAARALHDAIPLLEQAEEVTVLSLQLPPSPDAGRPFPGLDVAGHLKEHGITASYERQVMTDELGMVDHVLNRASDMGADLTVMGAHAPQGLVLQRTDTTAEIFRSMTTPVLLSH